MLESEKNEVVLWSDFSCFFVGYSGNCNFGKVYKKVRASVELIAMHLTAAPNPYGTEYNTVMLVKL